MMQISPNLQLVKKVKSKLDNTIKFIFLSYGQIIEFSYINKSDGKDIICAPTQTACNLGCKFCFLSDYDLSVMNLTPREILLPLEYIISNLKLLKKEKINKILLISFMGCGEPLLNIKNLIDTCNIIRNKYKNEYSTVRFAIATLIPKIQLMQKFTEEVKNHQLSLKLHLSLHSPDPYIRNKIMPSASLILESIILLEFFMLYTANSVEIHYTLINNVNDTNKDAGNLIRLLKNRSIPVKFLDYNKKPSLLFKESSRIKYFRKKLRAWGITTEFYNPPGSDIGSSCGQFLMDYYKKYNIKEA